MFSVDKVSDLTTKAVLWELSEIEDYIELATRGVSEDDQFHCGYLTAMEEVISFLKSRMKEYKNE